MAKLSLSLSLSLQAISQLWPSACWSSDCRPNDIWPNDVRPNDVWPNDIRPKVSQPNYIRPNDCQPRDCWSIDNRANDCWPETVGQMMWYPRRPQWNNYSRLLLVVLYSDESYFLFFLGNFSVEQSNPIFFKRTRATFLMKYQKPLLLNFLMKIK